MRRCTIKTQIGILVVTLVFLWVITHIEVKFDVELDPEIYQSDFLPKFGETKGIVFKEGVREGAKQIFYERITVDKLYENESICLRNWDASHLSCKMFVITYSLHADFNLLQFLQS